MSAEPSVKLVKKEQRKGSELQAEVECAIDLNRWPTGSSVVGSCISEASSPRIADSFRQSVQVMARIAAGLQHYAIRESMLFRDCEISECYICSYCIINSLGSIPAKDVRCAA